MQSLLALVLLAHLFVTGATTPQTIPSVFNGRCLIAATINGHTLWFHLDTGTSGLAIDQKDARASGMTIQGDKALADVDIGPLHGAGAAFSLLQGYAFDTGGVHVSGLIGQPFFRSNVVTIDFVDKRVTVYPNGSFDPSSMHARPEPIDASGGVPRIHAWFGSTRAALLLDTGAGGTYLFAPFARNVEVGAPLGDPSTVRIGFGAPETSEQQYVVRPMIVGGVRIEKPVVWVSAAPPDMPQSLYDGILGRDLLSLFALTIDYADGVAYFEYKAR